VQQASHPAIQTGHAKWLKTKAVNGTLLVHADGETFCTDGTQLELFIQPKEDINGNIPRSHEFNN
jgi:hypothetical protein